MATRDQEQSAANNNYYCRYHCYYYCYYYYYYFDDNYSYYHQPTGLYQIKHASTVASKQITATGEAVTHHRFEIHVRSSAVKDIIKYSIIQ